MSYASDMFINPYGIAELLSHGRPQIVQDPTVLASVIAVLCSHPSYRSTAAYLSECARIGLGQPPQDERDWIALVESEQVAKVLAEDIDPLLAGGASPLFSLANSSVGGALGELPSVTRVEVSGTGLSTARRVASVVEALPPTADGRYTDEVIVFCIDGTPTTAGLEVSRGRARPVLVDSVGHVTYRLNQPVKRARYKQEGCPVPDTDDLASSPEVGATLADVITVALASRE